MPSILRSARYRRDARAMEEEEEMWFEQEDDLDDGETIIPMPDNLRRQLDSEFDSQINRLFDSKKCKFLVNRVYYGSICNQYCMLVEVSCFNM